MGINKKCFREIVKDYRNYEQINNTFFVYKENVIQEKRPITEKERKIIESFLTNKKNIIEKIKILAEQCVLYVEDNTLGNKNVINADKVKIKYICEKINQSLQNQISHIIERKDDEYIHESTNEKKYWNELSEIINSADKHPGSVIKRFFFG